MAANNGNSVKYTDASNFPRWKIEANCYTTNVQLSLNDRIIIKKKKKRKRKKKGEEIEA